MRTRIVMVVATLALALAIVGGPVADAQQSSYRVAVAAMTDFLTAWLVNSDMPRAMTHFGVSEEALDLAPTYFSSNFPLDLHTRAELGDTLLDVRPDIASGYSRLISAMWPGASRVDARLADILVRDDDIIDFLSSEFDVEYIQIEPFVVFVADEAVEINTFDAGFGSGGFGAVATTLLKKPTRTTPILTMIAEPKYADGNVAEPIVAFWDEEPSANGNAAWRIQALGAVER